GQNSDTKAEELMKVATLEPVPAVRDALGSIVPAKVRKKVQVSVFVDENVPESLAETIRERLIEAAPVNAALTGTASPWNVPTQLDASSQDRAVFRTTGTVRLYIPLSDRVDLEAERSRLSARLREAEIELLRLEDKLAN